MNTEEALTHLLKQLGKRHKAARADRMVGAWDIEGTKRTDARIDEIMRQATEIQKLQEAMKVR
tara:strand:+ start:182 stop:370 length:189 start_codon:yes stop_codon:yes gene_type:complete